MPNYVRDNAKFESLQSEAAVLGSMIMEPECIPHVLGIITRTDMFFRVEHQQIFDAIVDLHIRSVPIDAVALRDRMTAKNITLDNLDGVAAYLAKILDSIPSTANHEYYAKAVRDRASYRAMFRAVEHIQQIPHDPGTVNEQIAELHRLALSVQPEREDKAHTFEDGIGEAVVELAENRNLISTGFAALNRIIRGFLPGKLMVLAGRPGAGKSSIAMDIALALGKAEKSVLFFSLEMTAQELMQRAACSTGSVNTTNWPTNGAAPQAEFSALMQAAQLIENYPITVYESVETAEKMYALADIRKKSVGLELVIIDNVQIMTTEPYIEKEYSRLVDISRKLKRMAVSLSVPILLISHLSRKVDERRSHRPTLSDLRGSGTLEQDADLVFMLYREDMYRRLNKADIDDEELDGEADLIVAKNRGGKTGVAKLCFRREYTTFRDLAHVQPEFEATL